MHLKIFICLCFLGGTFAMKIGIGENRTLHDGLKNCLSTLMKKVCPDCVTAHLVIPTKPSWEADILVHQFSKSSTIHTMDRPGYEDPLYDQIGLYLANTEDELKMGLKHIREAKSERHYVIWVNFSFGPTLSRYLKNTFSKTLDIGYARGAIFVALIDDNVQVFGIPIEKPGSHKVRKFTKLDICDNEALIKDQQPKKKVVESPKTIVMVAIQPGIVPFIERQTDSPGGVIGKLMNILEERSNFTSKYEWSYEVRDSVKFQEKFHGPRMTIDLLARPKDIPPSASLISFSESHWIIATPNPFDKRNILASPFKHNILPHSMLLAVYTSVVMYLCRDVDKTRIMLRLFGMFFGVGVGWFPKKWLLRFLVVLWCFTSYILVQAYLAALTSELSYPLTGHHIRNANDLMDSGIDMYCRDGMKEFYCNLGSKSSQYICKKCLILDGKSTEEFYADASQTNKTSWRPFAFHINKLVFKSTIVGKQFSLMPERIGTWPGKIESNLGEEFMGTVANVTGRLLESGILQYWFSQYLIKNVTDYEYEPEMLNMSHLNDIFIILYVGWSCSIIVFIIEMRTPLNDNN